MGELYKRFPQAKVILLRHPGGFRGWIDSMQKVCRKLPSHCTYQQQIARNFKTCHDLTIELNRSQRAVCEYEYDKFHDEVKSIVPPENLLEFTPSDGWTPLVNFLNTSWPMFPHTD